MEVLVGPKTYSMDMEVSSAALAAYVRDRSVVPQDNNKKVVSCSCLFFKEEEEEEEEETVSSSIGSDDEGKDANGDVSSSKLCLNSLEDSLPIKRGLSSHFSGKSKSFTNLSEVSRVNDLEKPENPFNKRRRVLIANSNRWSSFYSWKNPKSMPLLTVHEDGDQEEHHSVAELGREEKNKTRMLGFKSQSCFSLADLDDQ